MKNSIQIVKSEKAGLNSKESYVVARSTTSFLRILGCEPEWELMTATASEDRGGIRVCSNQLRLVEAALRLGTEIDTRPKVEKDWMEREYVKICVIRQDPGQDDVTFNEELSQLFNKFFEFYENDRDLDTRSDDEMRELHGALAINDQGDDVYLSDGVWLSNDGSLHDSGR